MTSVEVDAGNETFYVEDGCLKNLTGEVLFSLAGFDLAIPPDGFRQRATAMDSNEVEIIVVTGDWFVKPTWTPNIKPDREQTASGEPSTWKANWRQEDIKANYLTFYTPASGNAEKLFLGYSTTGFDGPITYRNGDQFRVNVGSTVWLYTIFARKNSVIHFNSNGGAGGQQNDVTATWGSAMPSITTTKPSKTGYTFVGWYDTSASSGGTQYYTAACISARNWDKEVDTTLYARWTANKYTVSFNANGGSGGQGAQVTATYGSAMPAISTTKPTRTGYTFGGWWDTSAASGGTQYYTAAGASARSWNKTANATLYARWTANKYTVSFNANGGSGGQSANVTATYDSVMPTISTTKPTRTGYTFAGWWDTSAANGGTQYYNASCTSARTWNKTANATLYARWTANTYTVSFNADGGSGGQSAQVTATYDVSMPAISTTKPTRTGYTFAGWYDTSDASGGTQYYTAAGASARSWNKVANTTLYARWTTNKYTVSFNANGGAGGQSANVTATYASAMPTISTTKPTRTGYAFAGWWDGADCSAPDAKRYYTAEGASARAWDKAQAATLCAGWEAIPYAISYDAQGGELSEGARSSYTIEDAFELPSPVRYGYQLQGWEVAGAGEGGAVLGAGVEDVLAADGSKATRVKAGTYGDLSCTARWALRYDLDVPVADPGSVTFEADSLTGEVRVAPGTSAEGSILSYMAVPVSLESLSCEGLDASGEVPDSGGAPELEAVFGPGSASKVRFTAALEADGVGLSLKVSPGQVAAPPALATHSIPAATSHDDPGRLAVSYGLELDPDLPIPPVREAAPVARLTYKVSLPAPGA